MEGQEMTAKPMEQLSPRYIIDVTKPFHVSWWAVTLGVTEQDLVRAVNMVGTRAIDARYYLSQEGARPAERRSQHRLRTRPLSEERPREPTTARGVLREGRGIR